MSLRSTIVYPLTVFYDGSCPVCSREIAYYRGLDRIGRFHFVDISDPSFNGDTWRLDKAELMKVMHVQDAGDRIYRGVDAFRALWLGLPGPFYPRLGRLLGLPGLHLLAEIGYRVFARMRHRLPGRLEKDC